MDFLRSPMPSTGCIRRYSLGSNESIADSTPWTSASTDTTKSSRQSGSDWHSSAAWTGRSLESRRPMSTSPIPYVVALGAALLMTTCGASGDPAAAAPASPASSAAGNPLTGQGLPNPAPKVTRNWGQLPAGRMWGTTAGVDIDPLDGNVWAYERCGAPAAGGAGGSWGTAAFVCPDVAVERIDVDAGGRAPLAAGRQLAPVAGDLRRRVWQPLARKRIARGGGRRRTGRSARLLTRPAGAARRQEERRTG